MIVVHLGEESAHHVLDLSEALTAKKDRLIVGDVVGLHTHPGDVQRPQVGLRNLLNLAV